MVPVFLAAVFFFTTCIYLFAKGVMAKTKLESALYVTGFVICFFVSLFLTVVAIAGA